MGLYSSNFNLNDFNESDFADPIALLEAIQNYEVDSHSDSDDVGIICDDFNISNVELLSLTDICHDYNVTRDEIIYAMKNANLQPYKIIPLFLKDSVENFDFNHNSISDAFEKEIVSMSMSYSYKPLLLMALLDNFNDELVSIEIIIDSFFAFFSNRAANGLVVEKNDSCFVSSPADRLRARRTILTYPVKVLAKKGFIVFDKNKDSVGFVKSIRTYIKLSNLEEYKLKCKMCLEKYYRTLL